MTETESTALAVNSTKEERLVVVDATNQLYDTARFDHMYRIAQAMYRSSLIADHLRNGPKDEAIANCFMVVNQATLWGMDPFAVAACTYVVGKKLGYEGKLVAALVNSRAGLKDGSRLSYAFSGTGQELTITVTGTFTGEETPRTVRLSVRQAKTNNKMWTNDPEQKLVYSGVTKWARRHCPEVILGVATEDDLDATAATRSTVETLDDLADDLMNTTPEPEHEQPTDDRQQWKDDMFAAFDAADSLSSIKAIETQCSGEATDDAEQQQVEMCAEAARGRIKESRGENSNGGDLLD